MDGTKATCIEQKIRADFLCPSGADIMSFCRDAALMSMRKVIKDKSPEEIKLLSKDDLEKPVTMDDFNDGNLLKGYCQLFGYSSIFGLCLIDGPGQQFQ